ncbi:MAG: Dyp-type peroxidase [Actinomycetota bacterium]|nr:Dyp-type peroxidase [Actinomycetota bacterium]
MIGLSRVRLDHADLQGGLLEPYRLPNGEYLFLRVDDPDRARTWLRATVDQVTTAVPLNGGRRDTTLNIAFSHPGLEALGVPRETLSAFVPEFREGMAARAERLGDTGRSAPENWDEGLGTGDAHILAAITARTEEALLERLEPFRLGIEQSGGLTIVHAQRGGALPDRRHHFGFRDGLSDVAVEGSSRAANAGDGVPMRPTGWRPVRAGEFILGYKDEDHQLPPAPPDPLGRNSTYVVYRKLYNDVALFREYFRAKAEELGIDEELLSAKIIGRWKDGTPLELSPDRPDPELMDDPARANDFRYRSDPGGMRCPVGAHIRRANPRDGMGHGGKLTMRHRIIRRGLPYGPPLPDGSEDDGVDRGLVFIGFNASFERQFETIQALWVHDGNSFGLGYDKDFLLGDGEGSNKMTVNGRPPKFLHPQPTFVITRGGEYLFQPGIEGLRSLASA